MKHNFKLIKYIFNNINQKHFKTSLLFSVVCSSTSSIILCYLPSLLISFIETGFSTKRLCLFIILFCLFVITFLISIVLDNQFEWYRFLAARFSFMPLHMKAKLYTPYNDLMNEEISKKENKAYGAISDNDNGIEGFLHSTKNFLSLLISSVFFCCTVVSVKPFILLTIIISTFLSYIITCKTELIDKEKNIDFIRSKTKQTRFYDSIFSTLEYAKDIRIFSRKNLVLSKYDILTDEIQKKKNSSRNLWIKAGICTDFLSLIQDFVIFFFLTLNLIDMHISISEYTLLISFATAFSSNMKNLLSQIAIIKKQLIEISDFYNYTTAFKESTSTHTCSLNQKTNEIRFNNVSYTYPGASEATLSDITVQFKTNDIISLVGLNGAGKTTFVKLLLGLLEPTEGYISLNNKQINSLDRKQYFSYFSPVFQDSILFAFSIQENVSLREKSYTDLQKLKQSLIDARINEKINLLPKKTDTYIYKSLNKNGVDFSGGEKQQISLARALYKNAPFFILDEPSSALDPLAEGKLYKDINTLLNKNNEKHYLTVFISHRMASSCFADRILYFKNGRISEQGTHSELMSNKMDYYSLYQIQKQYYLDHNDENELF